jgi:hypothetical protein
MIIISHNGAIRDIKPIKNYICTKIQAKCDFLIRLDHIVIHEVRHVEAYGDSLLVEQVAGEFQCLEESLKVYLDACLGIIGSFAEFQIRHVPRHENQKANMLAQQAYGYDVGGYNFYIQEQSMHEDLYFFHVSAEESAKPTALIGLADPDSLASQSAWPTLQSA